MAHNKRGSVYGIGVVLTPHCIISATRIGPHFTHSPTAYILVQRI